MVFEAYYDVIPRVYLGWIAGWSGHSKREHDAHNNQ